jgi:hypothetical protein
MVRYNNSAGQQGTLLMALGPNDSLDFYDNVDGNPNWNQSTVAGTGTTFGTPAVVRYDNSAGQQGTLATAPGPNDSLDFYSNVDDVSQWGEAAIAGAGTTFSDPAMTRTVADDGTQGTAVAVESPSGTLELYTNVDDVPAWAADQVAGPGSAESAPSIVRASDLTVVSAPSGTGTTALPPPKRGHVHRRRLMVAMQFTWRFVRGTTRLKSVRIGRLPRGASVEFSWRAGHRHDRERARARQVRHLARRLRGRTFRAGQRIYVRVSAPHRIAQRDEILIRAGRLPRMRALDRR